MNKRLSIAFAALSIAFFSSAQTWSALGSGIGIAGNSYPRAMTVYNGNLYVAGQFPTAGGNTASNIAQWNGSSWSAAGAGLSGGGNVYGYSLAVYNGNLYAGGHFDSAGGQRANYIAQWNGTSWASVGSGMQNATTSTEAVYALAVYNGNLYAAGIFDSAGGQPANNIAEWNGTSWSALGTGITDGHAGWVTVCALAVYNGALYAGGLFDSAGGQHVNNIAKWNGTSWSSVGSGTNNSTNSTVVYALCEYEGNLYAAGVFDTAGGIYASNIAKWNGTSWSAVDHGIDSVFGVVEALTVYNHELIASGEFMVAGTDSANNIAQWDGNNWYPLGEGVMGIGGYSLCTYNSSLIAGGPFEQAGNISCNNIAAWSGGPLPASNICYVTVDTASKYNEILWDKTGVDTVLVDSFRVYRYEIPGYEYLGSTSIHNYTQFVDLTSSPNTESATYEICSVDTSGLVSQLTSISQQTILLQANVGVGNAVNLSWNPYVGDAVSYYLILRDTTGSGNWQRFDSVPNNIYAYTDNNPPVSPDLLYIVNTVWNLSCVPYSNAPLISHELMTTNQVTSRSNRKQLAVTGIQTIDHLPSIDIYPNPSNDMVTITLSEHPGGIITLNNALGQAIYTDNLAKNENIERINLSGIQDGVYFIKLLFNDGSQLVRKIEIVK